MNKGIISDKKIIEICQAVKELKSVLLIHSTNLERLNFVNESVIYVDGGLGLNDAYLVERELIPEKFQNITEIPGCTNIKELVFGDMRKKI